MGWGAQHFTLKTKACGPTNLSTVYLGCRGGSEGEGARREGWWWWTWWSLLASNQGGRLSLSSYFENTHRLASKMPYLGDICWRRMTQTLKVAAHTACRFQDLGSRTTLPPANCGILKSLHLSKPQMSDSQMTTRTMMASCGESKWDDEYKDNLILKYNLIANHYHQ